MEEIDFEVSSPFIKTLVSLAKEYGVDEYLYPKTLYKNKHFIVFIPPIAQGNINSPDNIYIDDDFSSYGGDYDDDYDEKESEEAFGEFTLSYGFAHVHFESGSGEEGVTQAARRTLQMVKDLIERNIIGFHLRTEYGLDVTGYTLNQSDEELKEEFLNRAQSYAGYAMANNLKMQEKPFARICYWNETELKTIEL